MKTIYQSLLTLLILSTSLMSCTKETFETKKELNEQEAINEIRKIVGNKGKIITLNKGNYSSVKSQNVADSTKIKYISLDQLKEIIKIMNSKEPIIGTIDSINVSENKIKSNSLSPLIKKNGR